jgi:hypothetical protein
MNTSNPAWRFIILLLLSISVAVSCQQAKLPAENMNNNTSQAQQPAGSSENISAESGYAIPQGAMPDREPTYDDVVPTPGYGDSYRGNGIQLGKPAVWQHVESTKVKLNDGFEVVYRNHIETEAGQVRVNIFYIWKPGTPQGMKNDKVVLKLLHSQDNIQIRNIGEGLPSDGGLYEIILTAEIPPEIKPGDYDVSFILFINEKYQGTLPCTIHVVAK